MTVDRADWLKAKVLADYDAGRFDQAMVKARLRDIEAAIGRPEDPAWVVDYDPDAQVEGVAKPATGGRSAGPRAFGGVDGVGVLLMVLGGVGAVAGLLMALASADEGAGVVGYWLGVAMQALVVAGIGGACRVLVGIYERVEVR